MKDKKMDEKEIEKKLQAPFKPSEIEWRVGATNSDKTKGIALAYVTNRAIQKRLDDVFGIFGWKNEFQTWKDDKQLCGISVFFEGEWITKYDGADDSNKDATKGGLSSAMKRSACQWGIGRYLYDIPNNWYKIKQVGKSYVLAENPKLPDWALPKTEIKPKWDVKKPVKQKSKGIQECIKAFEEFGITIADLENYLHNEVSMFDENNLKDLRDVYLKLKNGANKDDFFEVPEIEVNAKNKGKELTEILKGVEND